MSKKRKVTLGIIVALVVAAGLGLVGLGEAIYRHSDGARGWSLGAGVYELLGWDAEDYRADFGQEHTAYEGTLEMDLVDEDGDGVPDRGTVQVPEDEDLGSRFKRGSRLMGGRLGRGGHGPFGIFGGLMCMGFVALLVGAGVVYYRRRHAAASG